MVHRLAQIAHSILEPYRSVSKRIGHSVHASIVDVDGARKVGAGVHELVHRREHEALELVGRRESACYAMPK